MTSLSGIKQDERGYFYRLLRGNNGAPLLRYCSAPVQLRVVGKFNPNTKAGEVRIHLQRLINDRWVRI